MERTGITRRGALTSAATLGVALPVLAACGDAEPESASDPSSPSDSSEAAETSDATPTETDTTEAESEGGGGLASTAEVPVGGGLILAKRKLVITQPAEGDFKGFTAVCTHQGCTVNQVTDTIDCPCHGSQFSIEDGSVVGGPAPSPLAEQELVVRGDTIDLA
jgi:Rieske Fe-S protein